MLPHTFFDLIEVLHPAIAVSQVISPEVMLLNSDFSVEITVENSGDTYLSNVSVKNDVFLDCDREAGTLPDLDLGESVTYSCEAANAALEMENSAVATAVTTEIEYVVEATHVVSPTIIEPLISLTVNPVSISLTEGESVTFILTVTNSSNTALTNVQIASLQITGCNLTLGSLDATETAVFNCTYTPSSSETISFDTTAMEPMTNTEVSTETAVSIEILPIVPPSIPTFTLFLPTIANNFISQNALGEPNNLCSSAFPVSLNQPANFLAEDVNDWYQFTLNTNSDLTISLTNFVPIAGQITLWRGNCDNLTLVGNNGDFSAEKSISASNQPAGTYYIWLINDDAINTTDLYTLSVQTP
ncbi:hypothetical protein MNBD_CHLOROFLEXI01-3067 [hydrothermal vent metagenome]|uniref:Peptidase C-terminal archaeal/bacterial domain-containing protein n=1 Tax=hydrothermal vent metagenome TaxID=652676 RepID=A0A3B0VCZ3_9ZZZZ